MKVLILLIALLMLPALAYGQSCSVELTWQDNSNNEEGFDIEHQFPNEQTWGLLAIVPADTTFFRDDFSMLDMCYRVRAFNEGGFSDYSNVACLVVNDCASPSNLLIQPLDVSDPLDALMVTRDGLPILIKRHKRVNGRIEILIGDDIEMEINGQRVP